eukprot:COSAG06_NODE_70036_length_194_cov_30.157895_1_plen_55_part_01
MIMFYIKMAQKREALFAYRGVPPGSTEAKRTKTAVSNAYRRYFLKKNEARKRIYH